MTHSHKLRLLLGCMAGLLVCSPVSGQERRLDLAAPVVSERPVSPGAPITLVLTNIVPRMRASYTVTVRQEVIPLDTLPFPFERMGDIKNLVAFRAALDDPDACAPPLGRTANLLDTATTEGSVSRIVAEARRDVPPACAERLNGFIRDVTTLVVEDTFALEPNQRLVVEVSRPGEERPAEWRYVFRTEPRGEWRTSYGFTFLPRAYPRYFTEQVEDDPTKFVVTEERGTGGRDPLTNYDFVPSILFTWLPSSARYRNWHSGLTAGLGYDLDEVTVFGGFSTTYNENVTLVAGLAIHEQPRLNPQFDVGEVLTEDLDAEALHVNRYGPNVFFGISFRFGSNPFRGGSNDEGNDEGEGGEGGGETRPQPGSEAPEAMDDAGTGGNGAAEDDLAFDVILHREGDTVGDFVVESVDVGDETITVVFRATSDEGVEVTGTYAPADGASCITLDPEVEPVLPYLGKKVASLCLTVAEDQREALATYRAGDAITVSVTRFRARVKTGEDAGQYDEARITDLTPKDEES